MRAARAAAQAPPELPGRHIAEAELDQVREIEPVSPAALAGSVQAMIVLEVLPDGVDDDELHTAIVGSSAPGRPCSPIAAAALYGTAAVYSYVP